MIAYIEVIDIPFFYPTLVEGFWASAHLHDLSSIPNSCYINLQSGIVYVIPILFIGTKNLQCFYYNSIFLIVKTNIFNAIVNKVLNLILGFIDNPN